MELNKRIFIVGQPGAGKGLLAKTVADVLNWQFINADLELERKTGCNLTEILGSSGVNGFYDLQYKILKSFLEKENVVIATDLNVVSSQACKDLLTNEFVVHLQVSTEVQLDRSARNNSYLLTPANEENFFNALHDMYDNNFEQVASYMLNSDEKSLDEHVASLVEIFQGINTETSKPARLEKNELLYFHKSDHSPVQLSTRQAQCLKLLATGKSVKVIAREINLSHRTVEEHIANMMKILGCSSSKELIALYHSKT